MKTKTYKELLTLMLNSEDVFNKRGCTGLCGLVYFLHREDSITQTEYNIITNYIEDNRPKRGKHCDFGRINYAWYWEMRLWPPRKAWLEYRITKH